MPASGSSIYTDADRYQASLIDILDLLVLRPRAFHARLTWLELPDLHLLGAQEASARIAYVRLPPASVCVTFATQPESPLIYGGVPLPYGDIILHSRGERGHQRTTGPSRWGAISLTPASLATFGRTIAGRDLVSPPGNMILRPIRADRQLLLRLHTQAARLAEKNLDRIGKPEVVRALEQDLIWALVTCLTRGTPQAQQAARRCQASAMARLEAMLAANGFRLLRGTEICRALGVSPRSLRAACLNVLGMSADRYQRLRRLNSLRAELLRARTERIETAEVIKAHGYADIRRFVAEYWKVYGELPPIPPRAAEDQ
jgi:AraC-like DNA-binding protein